MFPDTRIAVAQIKDHDGDLGRTESRHLDAIRVARSLKADILLFPELSLTGYLREGVEDRLFTRDDPRLDRFRQQARESGMAIAVGLPLAAQGLPLIATAWFLPDGSSAWYAKRFLHPGEEHFFGTDPALNPLVTVGPLHVAPAICYDIEVDAHAAEAARAGARLYAAGIFYSARGIAGGRDRLAALARTHGLAVAMANYCGSCWGLEAGGGSGIWNPEGRAVVQADAAAEAVLVAACHGGTWSGKSAGL